MGMKDLFRGYMFFKLVGLGIFLIFLSLIGLWAVFSTGDIWMFAVFAVIFLLGIGILKFSHNIYKGDKRSDRSSGSAGPDRYDMPEIEECPNCGSKSLQVYSDGAATCRRCDYSSLNHRSSSEG
ncbi:MAG: hypothetical protein ACOC1V_03540 [Candidatus Saliniplasma sp.]